MKYISTLFLLFFLSLNSLNGQTVKTAKILEKTFTVSYDRDKSIFEICEKEGSSTKCYEQEIENTNYFSFANEIRKELDSKRNDFEFKLFNQDKKINEFNTLDYTNINIEFDSSKITSIGVETEIVIEDAPKDFPIFTIKKKDATNYELTSKDEIFSVILINDSNDFSVKSNLDAFKVKIKSNLNSKTNEIGNYFSSIIIKQFDDLYQSLDTNDINKKSNYSFISTENLTPKNVANKRTFSFLFKQNKNSFFLLIDELGKDKPEKYGGFDNVIVKNDFVNNIINQHSQFEDDNDNRNTLEKIYLLIKDRIQSNKISEFEDDLNNSIISRLEEIENSKKTYSGQIYFNRKVKLYINEGSFLNTKLIYANKDIYLDSISIRLFNQRVDKILINAKTKNNKKLTLVNRTYSLPLREFNNRKQKNSFFLENDPKQYFYYYDDILDFKDSPDGKFNYAAKNNVIKITSPEKSEKIEERKIGDYFTGIFFSDFLGLNSNNKNSLIVAEGRIRIPWHLRNYGVHTLFDNLTAYASINLFNGFENSSRKIQLEDTFDPDETSLGNAENFIANNFNLLSNNNVDAGMHITPYTIEWKGASTFIHFRYGIRFLRTGIEYNLKGQTTTTNNNGDTIINETIIEERQFQVYSLGQELEVNFEIRPQSSVGADLTIGLNWFRATGTNKNDVSFSTINNTPNLKVMANIYTFTNSSESNSGVYARIGGHYNLGTYKLFPQIMVGYATNLSSFVNKLTK